MKKYAFFLGLFFCCTLLTTSCNMTTPEEYFGLAVLNSNTISGFATDDMSRQFYHAKANTIGKDNSPGATNNKETIDTRIKLMEQDLEKLKGLKETPNTKDILQSSLAMYNYVLPVYKNEYIQLAKLYDQGASDQAKEDYFKTIHDKYAAGFEALYTKLISYGKVYAEKHSIQVNWSGL